jgi:putative transposase
MIKNSTTMTKAEKIKLSLNQTRQKRKHQRPITYQLKLQNLTKSKRDILDRLFLEAKWLYNWLVADLNRLSLQPHKIKTVQVKVGDHFEERKLCYLGSQIKQEIADRIKDSLKALKAQRQNGYKTGKLKFKRYVNSIPLKQYGITYSFKNKQKTKIRLQGLGKRTWRVLGGHQIPEFAEITKAELIKKADGYYLHVTCYLPHCELLYRRDRKGREKAIKRFYIDKPIGTDFGVKEQLTFSNGLKLKFAVKETKRLKKLQKKLNRIIRQAKKEGRDFHTQNYYKCLEGLRKEYQKIGNIKKDIQNKILAFLKSYKVVCFQDDSIKSWQEGLFGRQVQRSAIGGVKARLRASLATPVVVDRHKPTTKSCAGCGKEREIALGERTYRCSACGWEAERDYNSALNMIRFGLGIPTLRLNWREVKPVEREAAARILGSNPYIRVSYLVEAGSPPL